jgi:hypothetical protein
MTAPDRVEIVRVTVELKCERHPRNHLYTLRYREMDIFVGFINLRRELWWRDHTHHAVKVCFFGFSIERVRDSVDIAALIRCGLL